MRLQGMLQRYSPPPVVTVPMQLAVAVVGVGAIFLPPLVASRSGPGAMLGWGYHLVAGLFLVVALSTVAARGGVTQASQGGVAELARTGFGDPAGAAVRWFYIIGMTVGQAVVATVSGAMLGYAVGGAATSLTAALGVAVVATGLGYAGWRPPAWLAVAAAAAVVAYLTGTAWTGFGPTGSSRAWADRSGPYPAWLGGAGSNAGTLPPELLDLGQTAFVLLFAFVGWEAVLSIARRNQGLTGRRGALVGGLAGRRGALVGGVAVVAVVYLGAAISASHSAAPAGGSPAGRILAGLAGLVCAVAVVRNLVAVTDLAGGGGSRQHRSALFCGAAVIAGVVLMHHDVLGLVDVLSVPNVMALAVFLTAAAAGVVLNQGRARLSAVLALLAYLALVPFAGIVVLLPVVVLLACALTQRTRSVPCR